MQRILLSVVLGLLPASICWGQYFTPVSTIVEAETWFGRNGEFSYANALVQGPDDYEDFGNQVGTVQASSQLNYMDPIFFENTSSTANGSVSIDPVAGSINLTLTTTPRSSDPDHADASATANITFYVPPNSGIHLGLNMDGANYNYSTSSLYGPDGLSWSDVSSKDIPSVPAGEYTLTCLAATQTITGNEFGGYNTTTVLIFPEPSEWMMVAGILSLIPIRRRRI